MRVPNGIVAAAMVQALAADASRAMGLPHTMGTCRVDILDPFLPDHLTADDVARLDIRCVAAYRTEYTGAERLSVVAFTDEDGDCLVSLRTADDVQLWPNDCTKYGVFSSYEDAARDPQGEVLSPFLLGFNLAPDPAAWFSRRMAEIRAGFDDTEADCG